MYNNIFCLTAIPDMLLMANVTVFGNLIQININYLDNTIYGIFIKLAKNHIFMVRYILQTYLF